MKKMDKEQLTQVFKWGGGIVIVLLAGSIALALLTSMLAIVACACLGLAAVHGWPVLATSLANWKYRQLRRETIENPIPSLVRQYDDAVSRFREKRMGVVKFSSTIKNFKAKTETYKQSGTDTTAMTAMYENMKRALEFQVLRLVEQQENLDEFKTRLGEAQDAYNMAMDMQEANNSLEQFTGETGQEFTLQREAFDAVTSKLNEGFARMEVSMALDYNQLPSDVQQLRAGSFSTITDKLKELEHV